MSIAKSSEQPQAGYLLAGQASELERLQLQSRVWEPSGRRLLEQIGDGRGARALDVGCGVLGWLRILSEWVGPDGEVTGTDIDAAMLGSADRFVSNEGLRNVGLAKDDLFASELEPDSFDLVHARYEICPLGRGHQQMQTYLRLARPGGTIVLEDPDPGSWHFNPSAPALERLIALIVEAFRVSGGDWEAGRKHLHLLGEFGIEGNIRAEVVALPPGHSYLRLPLQFATSLEERLLGLVSADELDELRKQGEAELQEPGPLGHHVHAPAVLGPAGVTVMTAISTDIQVGGDALGELSASFKGELVRPGDPAYDEHRKVWNGSIDRFPALIARCGGVADVIAAVRFAAGAGLRVAVRSGGHSYPGLSVCDGGIVIDLGPMKGIRVDPKARTARVQAGALWGELDRETQAFGLATTGGIVTHTGVAGLTLGGGLGWLQRKHGLTIDQLLSVDLVTAGGELVKASHTQNVDLFWGLRGGGGNFGVVTEFEFRLHPVGPTVLAGPIFWPIEQAPDLLRFYRAWSAEAPDELMTLVVQRKALPLPSIPRELHGKQLVSVSCCHTGPIEEGKRVVRPLRAFGSPVLDLCEPKPYVAHQAMFDPAFPHGWRYYFRACDVAGLSDEVIDVMVEHGRRIVSPISSVAFFQMGGAVARVGESETAFNGRDAAFTVNINGNSETAEGFEAEREWARTFWSALAPHHTSVYVNFLMDEGEERIRQAYGADKYERLKALKRTYDPTNFFRLNQNIPPD